MNENWVFLDAMHIWNTVRELFRTFNHGEMIRQRMNVFSLIYFQILTQEDWHEVLYTGMSKTSPWTALYFILLMTFGNYVLFNLLVAILVEGFSAEAEVHNCRLLWGDITVDSLLLLAIFTMTMQNPNEPKHLMAPPRDVMSSLA
jgi:Ion transport protein